MSKYGVLKDNLKRLVGEEFEKTLPIIAGDYEDKIKRQAEEITRLLAENKKLKEAKTEDIEHWCDVCTKQSVIGQARAEGAEAAWELARKIANMNAYEAEKCFPYVNFPRSTQRLMNKYSYTEAAAKVEAWEKAKEKPQKTMMQDFFEKYPNANKYGDGTPTMRPCTLGYPIEGCAEHSCRECWSRPLEQIGGESDE